MSKHISCICESCKLAADCEYFEQTVEPVMKAVAANLYDMSDPFVRQLDEALESFTCSYFE